jgi:hypothetical protein
MATKRIRLGWQVLVCLVIASGLAQAQTTSDNGRVVVEQNATTATASGLAQAQTAKPDALLAVDQNRSTVIERIVNDWGDKLAAEAGISRAQLREMLSAMRADQLLAASLAGSLSGLHAVVAQALPAVAPTGTPGKVNIQALGDATQDLVYTPVTPCRLFDTRGSQGGLGTPLLNTRRTYGAITPVANQGGPGGCAAGASATVALIQIGTLTPGGSGLLQGGAQGVASFPNALILYQAGDQYGTAVAMPLNPANGRFDLQEQFAQADLYGDLLGYFSSPAATALDCLVNGANSLPLPTDGTLTQVNANACPAGYTHVSVLCSTGNFPQVYLMETGANGTFSCSWSNLSPSAISGFTRARCCRVPGH